MADEVTEVTVEETVVVEAPVVEAETEVTPEGESAVEEVKAE